MAKLNKKPIHRTIVIAPHPDDELLGCGGTLLRRGHEGSVLAWVIVTSMHESSGFSARSIQSRAEEVEKVRAGLKISKKNLYELNFPTTALDIIPLSKIIESISHVFEEFQPNEVFVPHFGDAHSDHRIVFNAVAACTKWFRYPSISSVLAYETPSETDHALSQNDAFVANKYVDIEHHIKSKLELLRVYKSELGKYPFPRSINSIKALSQVRGSQSGFIAAEAFHILKDRS